jgi:hypothetical protein
MSSLWYDYFKQALHCANEFFKERVFGQTPEVFKSHIKFIEYVLFNNVADQLKIEITRILLIPSNISAMKEGLVIRGNARSSPGKFFKIKANVFKIITDKEELQLDMNALHKLIADFPEEPKKNKPNDIVCYMVSMFSKCFREIITQFDDGVMDTATRTSICMNSYFANIDPPYSDQKGQTIRNLLSQVVRNETVNSFLTAHGGEHAPKMIENIVQKFDVSSTNGLQKGLFQASATQSIDPIINEFKNFYQTAANNISSIDPVNPNEQC